MQTPENTKVFITNIKFGDLDSLGKGNNTYKPQSGIEISYKLFSEQPIPGKTITERVVVGGGTFAYPLYSEILEFPDKEAKLNDFLKSSIQDVIIACETILENGLKARFTSIIGE